MREWEEKVNKATEMGKEAAIKGLEIMKPWEFTGLKILEALAATGLRSVWYCKEIGVQAGHPEIKVSKITSNDWDVEASKIIERNFEFNKITCE